MMTIVPPRHHLGANEAARHLSILAIYSTGIPPLPCLKSGIWAWTKAGPPVEQALPSAYVLTYLRAHDDLSPS